MLRAMFVACFACVLLSGTQAVALAGGLPENFDLEVLPASSSNGVEQGAIIYKFRNGRVTSQWTKRVLMPNSRSIFSAKLKGTFIGGQLRAKQVIVVRYYRSHPSVDSLPGADPSKPVSIVHYDGTVRGEVAGHATLQIHYSHLISRIQSVTPVHKSDANGNSYIAGYEVRDIPVTTHNDYTEMDFALTLPRDPAVWFKSPNFIARGKEDWKVRNRLERLQGQLDTLSENLFQGKLALAKPQWKSIQASMATLKQDMSGKKDMAIDILGSPADKIIRHLERYEKLSEAHVKLHQKALTQNDFYIHKIQELKLNFMANVVKTMLKSFISWTNVIPTDLYAGLEGYSLNTSLLALPKTLVSWKQQAEQDASVFNDQKRTIMMMGEFTRYWDKVARVCRRENRKIHDYYKSINKDRVLILAREIRAFFAKL